MIFWTYCDIDISIFHHIEYECLDVLSSDTGCVLNFRRLEFSKYSPGANGHTGRRIQRSHPKKNATPGEGVLSSNGMRVW